MSKKFYSFLFLLTAFLWLGTGTMWGDELNEGFEGTTFAPDGWTNTHVSGTAVWDRNTSVKRSGSASARVNNASYGENYLITPKLKPQSGESLTFYAKVNENANNTVLTIEVSTTTTAASSFTTTLVTYNTGSKKSNPLTTSWVQKSISLNSYAGQEIYVAFHAKDDYGASNIFIDDVAGVTLYEEEQSSCANPVLGTPTILPDGVTLTWTAGGEETAYQYACVAKNATPESWTNVPGTELTLTLHDLTVGTSYDLYVRSDCGEEQSSGAKVNFTPTCPAPTAPSISNIGATTADLSWTAAAGISKYQYVAAISGQTPNWDNAEEAAASPVTLSGLQPGKTYKAYVRSFYSATSISSAVSTADFQTECAAVGLPYSETFDATNPCWKLEHCHSSTGVNSGRFRFYYTSAYPQYLISPEIEVSASPVQVEFEYQNSSNSYPETFQVGYSTTTKDVDAFTWGDVFTASDNTKVLNYSDVLPAGVKYIAIQCTSDNMYYLYIDNFSVSEYVAPACEAPTAVVASDITNNSASISWTNGGEETSWKLQYKKSTEENWTAANGGAAFTTKPFALSGLEASTTYNVQVKAICDEESEWSDAGEFTTDCDPVNMLAKQEFGSSLPECWKLAKTGGYDWASNSTYKVSASYSMYYYGYTATENYSDLITPSVTLTEDANLKFQLRNYYYGSEADGEVYIVTGSTTTKLLDFPKTTYAEPWALQTIDLSAYTGQTVKFIFRGHGKNSGASFYIDDVEVSAKPCDAPTGLSKVETSSSVALSWTDDAASKWNLRWREVTEPESAWNDVENLTAKNLSLSTTDGLVFGKNYQAQVQAVCTDVKSSDWSSLISFELVCNAPTALAVTARTDNSATFSWTSSESAWVLQYSADGENWESENVTTNPFTLSGLTAGTNYQAKIQSACGSEFSNVVSFKTWCDEALTLPVALTSFTAVPACWEESPAGAIQIANNKLCFVGEGEKFLYLPKTAINLNLLSVTLTFGGSLELGYISAPNGAFTQLIAAPVSGTEYDLATLAPEAAGYLAIRYNGASSWAQASISAVNIRRTPTCLKLDAPTATPGVGSASISWIAGSESAWNLQYKLASATEWTDATGTIASPFALNGLEQGVSYKVRVQANCGEELSDWSDEASFTTDCDAVSALPFIETFDAALSNCWTIYSENTTTYASQVYGGELRLPGGKEGAGHVVVLPEITASLATAKLTIEYTASSNGETPEVGYVTDKADKETFVQFAELDKSANEARIDVSSLPAGAHLALRYDGTGSTEGTFAVQEIRILEQLTLPDNVDNTATLSANLGKAVDVTIGRTFVCAGYYNTICLPFSLSAAELAASPIASNDLWAFKYARVEGGELLIRIVEAESINAGEPYLISWPEGDNIENPLFKNVTISASVGKVMGNENLKFVGTLKPETFVAHDDSKLFLYQNNTLYWWNGDAASSLKSFRAFFTVEGGAGEIPIKNLPARIIKEEQETTGIDNTGVDAQALKLLENGCVVIIRNGVKYNIQGQVIEK
ncbi:MAG: choice-of-anchor J domain-containing protein [Paludibacteraceae bacterium]|nr:choice-of-anchor J domain-containing protein [Paludibacteraceae bacterium]